jgi:hypothetical protein
MNIDLLEHVWNRCVIEGEHWIWKGATNPAGNPVMSLGDRITTVRRVVLQARAGRQLSTDKRAVTLCDHEQCVSPHCAAGLTLEKARQLAASRGAYTRNVLQRLKAAATRRARSRITDEAVRRMRDSSEPVRVVADREGVHHSYVTYVRQGKLRCAPRAAWSGLGARP